MKLFWVFVATNALLLADIAKAAAASPSETAAAQALFDEARRLISEGHFPEACPKLEESQRLDPAWGTLINLADCYEKTGRTATAWIQYMEVASGAEQARQVDRARVAADRARQLEPNLSKLSVSVPFEHRVEGLQILRDHVAVGAAQWGVAVPVDPGSHLIEARAPGFQPWNINVYVADGRERREVVVPKLQAQPRTASKTPDAAQKTSIAKPSDANTQPRPGSLGTQKIIGIATASVGLLSLGTAGIFAIRAKIQDNEAPDDDCPQNSCAVENGHIATGFLAAGAALAAGGAVLYFTAPTSKAYAVSVRSRLSPDGVGISISGSY